MALDKSVLNLSDTEVFNHSTIEVHRLTFEKIKLFIYAVINDFLFQVQIA